MPFAVIYYDDGQPHTQWTYTYILHIAMMVIKCAIYDAFD